MTDLLRLLEILGVSEDEAIRAMLSSFASVQPGPFRQKLLNRAEYGSAPSTSDIWLLLSASGFRCSICGSHGDLTLDHRNMDTRDSSVENLRVLCNGCNRSINSRPVVNRNANVRVYKSIVRLLDRHGRFPTPSEIMADSGLTQLSGSIYLIRFFEHKLGVLRPVRSYQSRQPRLESDVATEM